MGNEIIVHDEEGYEPSYLEELQKDDFLALWKPVIDSGEYVYLQSDQKIHRRTCLTGELMHEAPLDRKWIYTNNPTNQHCAWYHSIALQVHHFIPSYCLNCWKVVVRPQSIVELFDLYDLQLEMVKKEPDCYCKLGCEEREFVFGNYGGYFYNRSLEAGLDRRDQVRELAKDIITDPEENIYLKRYCSEFELKYGPSAYYRQPPNTGHWERIIEEKCNMIPTYTVQPEDVRRRVKREWIKFAWDRGDKAVYTFTNDEPIVRPCVRYDRPPEDMGELIQNKINKSSGKQDSQ